MLLKVFERCDIAVTVAQFVHSNDLIGKQECGKDNSVSGQRNADLHTAPQTPAAGKDNRNDIVLADCCKRSPITQVNIQMGGISETSTLSVNAIDLLADV